MWAVSGTSGDWPVLADLKPVRVLDEYDGPRLFTVRSQDGYDLLAYQCGEDATTERFLITPIEKGRIDRIEANGLTLREVLTDGWLWIVDRDRSGVLTKPIRVDASSLPSSALPRVGVRLNREPEVFLRLRMIGPKVGVSGVPAHVVKRTAEGAMRAVKTLVSQVLAVDVTQGRPTQALRQFYDLPALSFAQRSFEVAFGYPDQTDRLDLGEAAKIKEISEMFQQGLSWAISDAENAPQVSPQWQAILEAVSAVAPPQQGDIVSVEVSGALAGTDTPIQLTREVAQRVVAAKRRITPPRPPLTLQGRVRELDKDRYTFILRSSTQPERQVAFDDVFFEEVSAAFGSDDAYSILVNEDRGIADLVSITRIDVPPSISDNSNPIG
jgi:hypothetical protein